MTGAHETGDEPMTPERFMELWELAGELMAADAAAGLWIKIYTERRAARGETGPVDLIEILRGNT